MLIIASILVGYLLGAVPTGALVARAWGGPDLTRVGSGRTGATNVLRTLGKKAAAIVFLGDFLKGVVPVLIARAMTTGDPWAAVAAAMAAVVGHCYSPFMGFRGGRGVATGLGSLFALAPVAGVVALVFGVAAIILTRYVSLGSILGTIAGAVAVLGWVLAEPDGRPLAYAIYAVAVAAFIVVAHRDNIGRLRAGTERKFGQRVSR